jgi:hypothetical protein
MLPSFSRYRDYPHTNSISQTMTQPNELLLIGPQHGMVWRELLAKEGDQIYTLVENHGDA